MNYFITKVRYEKLQENGMQKMITEAYLVDALSFTEAEARITEEMKPFISGDFTIQDISRYKVSEAFLGNGDRYYKCKLEFISLDEKNGSEKKQSVYMLVQASTLDEAKNTIVSEMKKSMTDYSIAKIEETSILDVF